MNMDWVWLDRIGVIPVVGSMECEFDAFTKGRLTGNVAERRRKVRGRVCFVCCTAAAEE
jgi:hypothetical protein